MRGENGSGVTLIMVYATLQNARENRAAGSAPQRQNPTALDLKGSQGPATKPVETRRLAHLDAIAKLVGQRRRRGKGEVVRLGSLTASRKKTRYVLLETFRRQLR